MDDDCGPSVFVKNISSFFQDKGIEIALSCEEDCDLVFVVITTSLELIKEKKKSGAKILQRLGGVFFDKDKDYKGMNLMLQNVLKEADLVIYQSQFAKEMCNRYLGMPDAISRVIYNPVDTSVFTPYGKKIDFGSNVVLAVSTWRPWKRLQDSVEAINELLKVRDDITFIIIGRGVNIEGRSSHIRYLGEIPHHELPLYYRSADLFLFPSWLDGCPNVVLESLASGTPVICTDTGGTKELVGEGGIILKTGYVYDYEPKEMYNIQAIPKVDPKGFAKAINTILERRKEYSFQARRQARRFSLDAIGSQYLEAIMEIL